MWRTAESANGSGNARTLPRFSAGARRPASPMGSAVPSRTLVVPLSGFDAFMTEQLGYFLQRDAVLQQVHGGAYNRIAMSADTIETEGPQEYPDLPWPLSKATFDTDFAYLVILRNSIIVECTGATRDKNDSWITLKDPTIVHPTVGGSGGTPFNFERGMCVRVDEIAAAVDAPHGS